MSSVKVYRNRFDDERDRVIVVLDDKWCVYVGEFANNQPYTPRQRMAGELGQRDAEALVNNGVWGKPVYEWSDG